MNKALCAEAHEYRLPRGFEGPLAVHVKRSMNEDLLTAIMLQRSVMAQDKLKEVLERKEEVIV